MKQAKASWWKWSEEAGSASKIEIQLESTPDIAASIAKEIVVHAEKGAFILLYLDGEEMHVYTAR
jgi:hypothetical protein